MATSKTCKDCGVDKPLDEFHKCATGKFGRQNRCKPCAIAVVAEWQKKHRTRVNARNKAWKESHRDQVREAGTRYAFARRAARKLADLDGEKLRERTFTCRKKGLTVEQYEAKLKEQNGVCAICGAAEANTVGWNFAIDHWHSCCGHKKACSKCVRGLLCIHCNTTLHKLEMIPGWVEKATAYLGKYAKPS